MSLQCVDRDGEAVGAEEPAERHVEELKGEQKSEGHHDRERHRQAIEWKGEGAPRHRSERPPREEKRHRDEPRSERHGSQREPVGPLCVLLSRALCCGHGACCF